jgi:parallel beta-helix repeat protein
VGLGLGRRTRVASVAVGVAVVFAFLVPAGEAYGVVRNVAAGQSIQAAVNAANPGDTINVASGTFRESVEVTKSLTILGAGQGSTILQPPASPSATQPPVCQDPSNPNPQNGFCIHGTVDQDMNVVAPVGSVRVSGFTVKNFSGVGIFYFGASSPQVDHNTVLNNAEYGAAAFVSTNDRFTDNIANKNGEAGIYVGDSPGANAVINNNQANNNANFGIFVRDASGTSAAPGKVTNNLVRGNCAGILFLNTGSGEAHWEGANNQASANNAVCSGDEGPSAGGIGVAAFSPDDVKIHDNLVTANQPSGQADISGGIVVGGDATNIAVARNDVHRNAPDLLWDESGSATFTGNSCKTSSPAGLCKT